MEILNQSMGDIARDIPGATAILYKLNLDFCCGGAKSLRAGLTAKCVDAAPVIEELKKLSDRNNQNLSLKALPNDELIEHILERYHDVHREQLPELIRLAQRVERVHSGRPDCPVGLWVELENLLLTLDEHMCKEEDVLFPMISRNMNGMTKAPIKALMHEHEGHGDAINMIDKLTDGIQLPVDACNTWRALYLGLETFKSDLMNHIHLENNILFARVNQQE